MKRLKQLMFEQGLSNRTLGEMVGIDRTIISRYANGRQQPRLDRAQLVARALGVSVDYLSGEDSLLQAASPIPLRGKVAKENTAADNDQAADASSARESASAA